MELVRSAGETVRIYGRDVTIARPTFRMIESFQSELRSHGEAEAIGVTRRFLESLGVPGDLIDEMEVDHVNELVQYVVTPKKKT